MNKKVWVLMWYGVDESACYGVVSDPELVKEWQSRGDDNHAEMFILNEMPEAESWRDNKLFPPKPMTNPIAVFYGNQLLKELQKGFMFGKTK